MSSSVDATALARDLAGIDGEVRFDTLSRALYSSDASVYQILPLGVVLPKTREDLVRLVNVCRTHRCPITMRGGGTSQAGQCIGDGLIVDISKHFNRLLEVNAAERWARVEPGIVLDELNGALLKHGLRFAPDISSASRATVGGMIANNSAGARSVVYGKTIDHVLELTVLLADGSILHCRETPGPTHAGSEDPASDQGATYAQAVRAIAETHAAEIERRFPKVLRRVGGYNLDEFLPGRPFNLSKLFVGSEGTLGIVLEAKVNLVPLPKTRVLMAVQFDELLDALAATPIVLTHGPSAVEAMDAFILNHTKMNAELHRLRQTFVEGEPAGLLCVEFAGESLDALIPKLDSLEADLRARGLRVRCHRAIEPASQQSIWHVRESALGLSMSMKGDAKAISFVEDAAVAPERLRDYIAELIGVMTRHGTEAGIYAHASVGCLHVRPVVNLKTEAGVKMFESIASDVADLVLKYGGALSGEHGDGLVRSPFMERMFGPVLYEAFKQIKRTFDPENLLNPGKIVNSPPMGSNLRYGPAYETTAVPTTFDYSEHNGFAGAVEMCSGLGACRKAQPGTMCPSFMATKEETHSTRGRANTLRLALTGQLGRAELAAETVREALDLCLECRACKTECPVGVDVGRMKSEFLSTYWKHKGIPLYARALGRIDRLAVWGSRFASVANPLARSGLVRAINERILGIDRRRTLPAFAAKTLRQDMRSREYFSTASAKSTPGLAFLFVDTFTNHFHPSIGTAALDVARRLNIPMSLAPNMCCGRPLISQGLLGEARDRARENARHLAPLVAEGRALVFLEPSCLSAVREDAPDLLTGNDRDLARAVAARAVLFEEWLESECRSGRVTLPFRSGPARVVLHGHCHQKSMGALPPAKALLARIPGATIVDPDAGCCGMAGSFGYMKNHFDVSQVIGERRLLPAARTLGADAVLVASGTSCRQQIADFTGVRAYHAAELVQNLLTAGSEDPASISS